MYAIIEKQTGKIIIANANEFDIETFFSIEDVDLYDVKEIQSKKKNTFELMQLAKNGNQIFVNDEQVSFMQLMKMKRDLVFDVYQIFNHHIVYATI
jgi:DNA repair ATPase RecN